MAMSANHVMHDENCPDETFIREPMTPNALEPPTTEMYRRILHALAGCIPSYQMPASRSFTVSNILEKNGSHLSRFGCHGLYITCGELKLRKHKLIIIKES